MSPLPRVEKKSSPHKHIHSDTLMPHLSSQFNAALVFCLAIRYRQREKLHEYLLCRRLFLLSSSLTEDSVFSFLLSRMNYFIWQITLFFLSLFSPGCECIYTLCRSYCETLGLSSVRSHWWHRPIAMQICDGRKFGKETSEATISPTCDDKLQFGRVGRAQYCHLPRFGTGVIAKTNTIRRAHDSIKIFSERQKCVHVYLHIFSLNYYHDFSFCIVRVARLFSATTRHSARC